jgi:hypothetical protein
MLRGSGLAKRKPIRQCLQSNRRHPRWPRIALWSIAVAIAHGARLTHADRSRALSDRRLFVALISVASWA